ncbi:NUDIX domain-containing protein [Streptomyces sp. SM14]|uniref:NUDIX domain-containing protein n=1 Tax=Streptomyces sp. SM14 TaxID=1736045 RepID=UPI000CD50135|nr:NUDIX domain-containing protein [Streptomyces sp. SM14]
MEIRYTADVVLLAPDPLRVLVIERGWPPHKGMQALPGGHVDPGETALDAAVRELSEETGVAVPPGDLRLVGVYDAPDRDPRGRYVSAAYGALLAAPLAARAGDDAADARWIPLTPDGLLLDEEDRLFMPAFDHAEILCDAIALLA